MKKSDGAYPHTADQLQQAFTALVYELQSFLQGGVNLETMKAGRWQNEVLEAYLVHARVLMTFLGANKRILSDDVTPANFGVTWKWPSTPEAGEVEQQLEKINKHLAHLTWGRTSSGLPGQEMSVSWSPISLVNLLVPIINQFIELLRSPHPDYAEALEANIKAILSYRPIVNLEVIPPAEP
jgi:hypothetical protein